MLPQVIDYERIFLNLSRNLAQLLGWNSMFDAQPEPPPESDSDT
jgi:hypothetical protein